MPKTPAPALPKALRKATLVSMLASPRGLWRFLTDRQAPMASKVFSVLALSYFVSPLDAIPDWLVPVMGWLDDIGVMTAALAFVAAQAARYENQQDGRPAGQRQK